MNGTLNTQRPTPPTSSPALTSSPVPSDPDQHGALPPPARDDAHLNPASAAAAVPYNLKAMSDLTDTPQFPLSVNSTAPSSPRM